MKAKFRFPTLRQQVLRFAKDAGGTTSIEYALVATLVAVAILPAASGLGGKLSSTFGTIADALGDAPTTAPVAQTPPASLRPMSQ